MAKQRLDKELLGREMAKTRSQAEDLVRRGFVLVNNSVIVKPGTMVGEKDVLSLKSKVSFVSRAGEKLYSVIPELGLDFSDKTILDVGSSTGGFTDVALRGHAKKVVAVDVGSEQLDKSLRGNPRVELHEKTDIRNFKTNAKIDMAVIDVSFISLQQILPSVARLVGLNCEIIAMVKPQFEVSSTVFKHKGVIKNDRVRRDIFKNFETWAKQYFVVESKADSRVLGAKGNQERFYKLRKHQR